VSLATGPDSSPTTRDASGAGRPSRVRNEQIVLPHVERGRGASLGAEAAVDAEVLVLDHDAAGLGQVLGHVDGLGQVQRGRLQLTAQLGLVPLGRMPRQSTGQTSTQASHSMQSGAVKWVWTSQFRQRSTSRSVASRS
jgi:hypothetical protein